MRTPLWKPNLWVIFSLVNLIQVKGLDRVNRVTRISGEDQTSLTTDRSGRKVPVYVPLDCEAPHTPLAVSASAFRLGRSSGMFTHGRRVKATRSSAGHHDHPIRNTLRCALRSVTHHKGAPASQWDSVGRRVARSPLRWLTGGISPRLSVGEAVTAASCSFQITY